MSGLDYLKQFLTNEGYKYSDNDNNISFKFQGVQFVAFRNDDSVFLQTAVIFYDVTDENRQQVLEACNAINKDKFMVKFFINGDSIWCNLEFVPNDTTTAEEFTNYLEMMIANYVSFFDFIKQ